MSEKSPWQMWKEKNPGDAVRPWDLLNPNVKRVDDETRDYRFNHCLGCKHLIKATKTCTKCGCFMSEKTKLAHASCPIGLWGAVTIEPTTTEGESHGG